MASLSKQEKKSDLGERATAVCDGGRGRGRVVKDGESSVECRLASLASDCPSTERASRLQRSAATAGPRLLGIECGVRWLNPARGQVGDPCTLDIDGKRRARPDAPSRLPRKYPQGGGSSCPDLARAIEFDFGVLPLFDVPHSNFGISISSRSPLSSQTSPRLPPSSSMTAFCR